MVRVAVVRGVPATSNSRIGKDKKMSDFKKLHENDDRKMDKESKRADYELYLLLFFLLTVLAPSICKGTVGLLGLFQ